MKIYFLCLLFSAFLFPFHAFAQEDSLSKKSDFGNSFMCSAFSLHLTKSSEFSINMPNVHQLQVFELGYERKIYKHLAVGIDYSKWFQFGNSDVVLFNGPNTIQPGHEEGRIQRLTNYKMFDFYATYKYGFKKHRINAGLGVSYAWGTNTVIDTIYVLPLDEIIMSHHENASYKGVLAFIGYDYLMFHDHFAIGYQIKWREYFGLYSPQLQNGHDVKVNF